MNRACADEQCGITFPDQSPSFLHGFEVGRIWQQMEDGMLLIEEVVSVANEAVLLQLGLACGYTVSFFSLATTSEQQTVLLRRQPRRWPLVPCNAERKEV